MTQEARTVPATGAGSTRRRGSSRPGKELPFRNLKALTSTSPAGVDTVLGRDPFRVPLRLSERSQRPEPRQAVGPASMDPCSLPFSPRTRPLAANRFSLNSAPFDRDIRELFSSSLTKHRDFHNQPPGTSRHLENHQVPGCLRPQPDHHRRVREI